MVDVEDGMLELAPLRTVDRETVAEVEWVASVSHRSNVDASLFELVDGSKLLLATELRSARIVVARRKPLVGKLHVEADDPRALTTVRRITNVALTVALPGPGAATDGARIAHAMRVTRLTIARQNAAHPIVDRGLVLQGDDDLALLRGAGEAESFAGGRVELNAGSVGPAEDTDVEHRLWPACVESVADNLRNMLLLNESNSIVVARRTTH